METATTLTGCRLAHWRAAEFLARFEGEPAFAIKVTRLLCRQICRLRGQVAELGCQTARQRFEALLRSWPRGSRAGGGLAGGFDLPLTRNDIAQLLSITPQYISGLLSNLEKAGLVRREKRHVIVLPAALRSMAAEHV